jgi:hypothetical protein
MTTPFVPGLELARQFYSEAVRPLLDDVFPGLRHSATLLGPGSEVLGFDTQRSVDHDWGPRLQIFLNPDTPARPLDVITATLAEHLPATFRGYPTAFPVTAEPDSDARHRVHVTALGPWLTSRLGFDPRQAVTTLDWLATPTQQFAEITAGAVFHDGLGELDQIRSLLTWYPHDVWLYVLACQWRRIAQEEAFIGRAEEVGDAIGSAVVTARLVRDLMRLCLLMRRRYPPYSKWLGTAFSHLPEAAVLTPQLTGALSAANQPTREHHLSDAYQTTAALHNELGITKSLDTSTSHYYDRPYQVLHADRFADALTRHIRDPQIRRLPKIGSVDQYIDSTDALGNYEFLRGVTATELGLPE